MSYSRRLKNKLKSIIKEEGVIVAKRIDERKREMKTDDKSHQLLYSVFGINQKEQDLVDVYQNTGRFIYNALGRIIETCAVECIKYEYPNAKKTFIPNTLTQNPKKFEIDCLIEEEEEAFEIKWRDATTDGDHVKKEHNRAQAISNKGYLPVRLTFFEPNRAQAKKIQRRIENLYSDIGGEFYEGNDAWNYIEEKTGQNLKLMLEDIVQELKE